MKLGRAAAAVHNLLVIEGWLALAGAPGLVLLVLLDRGAGNLPLVAACALPAGPALSAAVYALDRRSRDHLDLQPGRDFRRGYRLNAGPVLKLWAPFLAWEAVLGFNLANGGGWWGVPLMAAAALWQVNALLIASRYEFRTRDVARLAAYFLIRTPRVTLGTAALGIVAAAVVLLWSEAVLALVAVLFAAALWHNAGPLRAEIEARFVR